MIRQLVSVVHLMGMIFAVAFSIHAADVYDTPETAMADADFLLQGEYATKGMGLQVVALGDGKFMAVKYPGGLPGAGYSGTGKTVIEDEDAEAIQTLINGLELDRIERDSPTLGAKPPEGAVVLFDGTQASIDKHWKPGAKLSDGLLQQGCMSIDTFQDCTVHIEFRTPYMPKARGQGRGNSGIYYQGRYETQMLDSFGLDGKNNETGGIYTIRDPDLNMCLPPLTWQTYDADFTAARYVDGKKTTNARLTVRLNGVVVQPDTELPKTTTAAPLGESADPGPIYLQDHGNPVRYRNIWVVPRDAEREARRPIVPGFERFHALASGDPIEGGHLLIGELSCAKCHANEVKSTFGVDPKQAPILSEIGRRVRPEWYTKFLTDPQAAKPGTTMPNIFAGWEPAERDAAVQALAHFMASTGTPLEQGSNREAGQRGKDLFHQVGCTACHAPREGDVTVPHATTIPLGKIEKKYTIASLIEFLKNPHAARPSGRMPSMPLNDQGFTDIANYLVGEEIGKNNSPALPKTPNMTFKVYKGDWSSVPDFGKLKPDSEGESRGLDLTVAKQTGNFGARFEGVLRIDRDGSYNFRVGSDDGSALFIDGKKVADADGVHPHTVGEGRTTLTKGFHPIRVDYFQGGGEWTLEADIEGPGIPRQPIHKFVSKTPESAVTPEPEKKPEGFVLNDDLVKQGRSLFSQIGCAACHEMKSGGEQLTSPPAKAFAALDPSKGCLAAVPPVGKDTRVPDFALSPTQRQAIIAAFKTPNPEAAPKAMVRQTMTTFNCLACHVRDGLGGPESVRNALFTTTIPEMGDEGRLPPPLDGVGDKLTKDYLSHILTNGADDRPYMRVSMPKYGNGRLAKLHETFISLDEKSAAPVAEFDEPESRIKSAGRHLVGDKALACVKCHTFGNNRATGIQAIDMGKMTQRLREDWFRRYLVDPQAYRPGTRMPTGYPNGKATILDTFGGNPVQQIAAIWTYLKDGSKAGIPDGLLTEAIELKSDGKPVIYRNFIEGLSPRGIAVGYPEKCNIAWDANRMSLGLVWHGKFMDASQHWVGRGPGNQSPLGDHVTRIEDNSPVAILASADTPWPNAPPRERGYKFIGYDLDGQGRPAFKYRAGAVSVIDFPEPVAAGDEGTFRRKLTLSSETPVEGLSVRAASGSSIEPGPDGTFVVDKLWTVKATGGTATVRDSNGKKELLVPVTLQNGKAEVVLELKW
jgi:mono/diheme cytochrome c family protein